MAFPEDASKRKCLSPLALAFPRGIETCPWGIAAERVSYLESVEPHVASITIVLPTRVFLSGFYDGVEGVSFGS